MPTKKKAAPPGPAKDKAKRTPAGNGQSGAKGKTKGKGKATRPVEDLPVIHEKLAIVLHLADPKLVSKDFPDSEVYQPLTAANAKEMLGWEEEPAGARWGDYLLIDRYGRKIRCDRNSRNRPFHQGWAEALCHDILNKNWADSRNGEGRTLNGETIIIGRHGSVLSAQHRLVGLVLADQMWQMQPHWKDDVWGDEAPTIEAIIVFGVDESSGTVRTLDNTRQRSVEDVFVTEGVFGRQKAGERREMCKMLGNAVRTLWERTGAHEDAWHPHRTHSESVDFASRHPRVGRAVKHIYEENRQRKKGPAGEVGEPPIRRYIGTGTASALLFLMGASGTKDGNDYWGKDLRDRTDSLCDWSMWDRATEFWSDLAAGGLPQVNQAIAALSGPDGVAVPDANLREAILCRAWGYYKDGSDFATEDIVPALTEPNADGRRFIAEGFDVGGIDTGKTVPGARRKPKDEDGGEDTGDDAGGDDSDGGDEAEEGAGSPTSAVAMVNDPAAAQEGAGPAADDPTPEEIEARAAAALQEREERAEEKKARRRETRAKLLANRRAKQGQPAADEEE